MSSIPDDLIEDAQIALSEFRDVLGGCFEDAVDTVSRSLYAEREAQHGRFETLVKIIPVASETRRSFDGVDALDAWAEGVACAKRDIIAAFRRGAA